MKRVAVVSLLLVGCAPAPAREPVGISPPRPHDRSTIGASASGSDAGGWGGALLAALEPLTASPVPSRGHLLEKTTVRLYANARGHAVYEARVPTVKAEEGAVLVAVHSPSAEAPESATGNTLMRMEKLAPGSSPTSGDWRYTIGTGRGGIDAEGALTLCVTCHAEAPVDGIFRLPQ